MNWQLLVQSPPVITGLINWRPMIRYMSPAHFQLVILADKQSTGYLDGGKTDSAMSSFFFPLPCHMFILVFFLLLLDSLCIYLANSIHRWHPSHFS